METQLETFITKQTFYKDFELMKKKTDQLTKMPKEIEKQLLESKASQQTLDQMSWKIIELEKAIGSQHDNEHQQIATQQEQRLNEFQAEIRMLVQQIIQGAQRDLDQVSSSVRDDVQQFIKKEFMAKEARIDSKMENRQQ